MNELIININEVELGSIFFYNTITEAVIKSIPDSIQKHFQKKSNREKMLEEFGKEAFLLPDELKFPVINPFTKELDCRLIYAAYIRAKQHKYSNVEKQALNLYNKQDCQNKINITLKDNLNETMFECSELFEIFDFDNSLILEDKDEEYKKLYKEKLKEFNVDSIEDLNDEEKKKFFNSLEVNWTKEPKE
jgi:hypothetical protein